MNTHRLQLQHFRFVQIHFPIAFFLLLNQSEEKQLCIYLNVLHVLKEVWLGICVVSELHQVSELWAIGEGFHQTGQDWSVIVPHTLYTGEQNGLINVWLCACFWLSLSWLRHTHKYTSLLLFNPLLTASNTVYCTISLYSCSGQPTAASCVSIAERHRLALSARDMSPI